LDGNNARICKYLDTQTDFELLTHTPGFGTGSAGLLKYPTGIAMAKGFPHIIATELYTENTGVVMFINDLVIYIEDVDNEMIDPSIAETSTIEYMLSEYTVDHAVEIFDSQKLLVRTLIDVAGPVISGKQSVVWDGRSDQGQILPEGAYTVQISGQDPYNVPGAKDIYTTTVGKIKIEIRPQTVYITENTQWDETHIIYRDLVINPDVTLTLASGTTLDCRKNSSITVLGTLLSNGTEEYPNFIGKVFGYIGPAYAPPDNEYWQGIKILSTTPNSSHLNYTLISGGQTGLYVSHTSSMPTQIELNNVTIKHCEFGLYRQNAFGMDCNSVRIDECETRIYPTKQNR